MSQEKYIGMDVHQATISVAVMDAEGKLIMECLLETKAATIVEFIQGMQGTLSLTFEEGTSAAWLHDLLKPHVSRLVVCDPRKTALLKDGNKSDRIDARKLAELLRTNQLNPVYHGEHGVRTLKELGRSYLTLTQDVTRVMNRIKALYRSWAHSLQRHNRLCGAASRRVVGQDRRTRSSASSRTLLPATGCASAAASTGTLRSSTREPQASCREVTTSDSFHRSDSRRPAGGPAADAPPFPYQATAVGVQRFRSRNSRQRRVPLCARQTATQPRTHHRARSE